MSCELPGIEPGSTAEVRAGHDDIPLHKTQPYENGPTSRFCWRPLESGTRKRPATRPAPGEPYDLEQRAMLK